MKLLYSLSHYKLLKVAGRQVSTDDKWRAKWEKV